RTASRAIQPRSRRRTHPAETRAHSRRPGGAPGGAAGGARDGLFRWTHPERDRSGDRHPAGHGQDPNIVGNEEVARGVAQRDRGVVVRPEELDPYEEEVLLDALDALDGGTAPDLGDREVLELWGVLAGALEPVPPPVGSRERLL